MTTLKAATKKSVSLLFSESDTVLAKRLANRLRANEIACDQFSTSKKPVDEYVDGVIIIISAASVADQNFLQAVSELATKNIPLFPLRKDEVEISGSLAYYLKISQWLDLDETTDETFDELAETILRTNQKLAGAGYNFGKNRRNSIIYFLVGTIAIIGCLIFLWTRNADIGSRIDSIEITDLSDASSVYLYTDDYPVGSIPTTKLNVSLESFDRQVRAVEAAFYQGDTENGFVKLGETSVIPNAEYGEQSFQFVIAKAPASAILCLVSDRKVGSDIPTRILTLYRYEPESEGKVQARFQDSEISTCDAALGASVDTSMMPDVIAATEKIQAHNSWAYAEIYHVPYSGPNTIEISYSAVGQPTDKPLNNVTLYYYAPAGTGWRLLHRGSPINDTGKYKGGIIPKSILVCADTYISHADLHIATSAIAEPNKAFHSGRVTMDIAKGISPCEKFPEGVVEESAPELSSLRLVPLNSGGRFKDALMSPRGTPDVPFGPTLAGVALGTSFNTARQQLKDAIPELGSINETDHFGMTLLGMTQLRGIVDFETAISNARQFSASSKDSRVEIRMFVDNETNQVTALWYNYRPPINFVQADFAALSSGHFSHLLIEAYGLPEFSSGLATTEMPERQKFRMQWGGADDPCREIERPSLLAPRDFKCRPHLDAAYSKSWDNLIFKISLMQSSGPENSAQ